MPNITPIPTQTEVKKHVATVHVSGELSLLERKIVNVLLLNAYDDLLTRKTHKIPVGILSTMLGFDSKNTDALKRALLKVMSTPVSFDLLHDGGNSGWEASPLIGYASIRSGVCSYEYSDWLARKLANPEIYTLININVQKQFGGGYSLALYENCLRFKRTGSTGWISVETWRRLFGAEASTYDEFKHFNGEVIKKSVKEINTVSNITVTPEYKREARRVTQIRFLVEENPQKSMLDAGDDEQAKIRNSETFKRLTAIGIGDRLAISWMQQEPERAQQTAAYVEDKARRKQIKGAPGGYARTVFEGGGDLTIPTEKPAQRSPRGSTGLPEVDAEAEARAKTISAAIKGMDIDRRRELVSVYLAQGGKGNSYSPQTVTFSDVLERAEYTTWLRRTVAKQLAIHKAT